MKYASLDNICKSVLLSKGYTLHWYLQCLVAARDCLREITFDDLRVIKTELLPIDKTTNSAKLPCDYVDFTKVGFKVGQFVRPIPQYDAINRLSNYTEGKRSAYEDINYTSPVNWLILSTIDEYGESTGRRYGGVPYVDNYKILPERNEIQLNQAIVADEIVLEYISDGTDCNAATMVDSYAQMCIQTYILWQLKEHNRTYSEGEKERARQLYLKERKILRSRKNPLTLQQLKRIIQKASYAAPK